MRILILSTPVAPLASAEGTEGGITLLVRTLATALHARGHLVSVVAPRGSRLDAPAELLEADGTRHVPAQNLARGDDPPEPAGSVLAHMWSLIEQRQDDADVVLNLSYDPRPFDLGTALRVPVAHFVSMASTTDAMDRRIVRSARSAPGSVAMQTRAQAESFGLADGVVAIVGGGVDVASYPFFPAATTDALAWAGRIVPEKGLEDAARAAALAGMPLRVLGAMQDRACWERARAVAGPLGLTYAGYLPPPAFAQALAPCRALLVTPRWVEAFGLVVVEALACGVPVVAYRKGGPSEIVEDGVTGFLVEPGDVEGLATALQRVSSLDRAACRQAAEERFDVAVVSTRVEAWLGDVARGGAARRSTR